MLVRAVYSTVAAEEIARIVERAYGGATAACSLLRRGFNDVYEVRLHDGRHGVARLSSRRARGEPNIGYETALLLHLAGAGALVCVPWQTVEGQMSVAVPATEGVRHLVAFDYLQGIAPSQDAANAELLGRGLAILHVSGRGYRGPASLYDLELPHLLDLPLKAILEAPTMDHELRGHFSHIAIAAVDKLGDLRRLSKVHCHGDCHGGNNVIMERVHGVPEAAFFDFDDAGPGFLAYDLAVYLWSILQRMSADKPRLEENWKSYMRGYRSVCPVSKVDFDAIMAFVVVRHVWYIGEYASRSHEWGSERIPRSWLEQQVQLMKAWLSLRTPEY
ncbi:phosphotransferase enzyme family protein [Cupriavidus gilardii]|uniref:Phosphotransferase n=1 Tax=Cupriavidus gilardii TaxID=82541 RepID=A0A6N1B829_9BURK|nr:phosphotransferase [Cupriavidus gilardii]KAB0599171.1 phosphotransferase [Cupriavidus gilardii]MCT9013395.1 phosphotransferase [Cupriavidus gilardii]MCT9052949.1 phosphotransferase [Cupriavidus gilardii]MCT9071174.1 phosphotransferase [Cupriavidus gilardii]NNH13118.1 phosphotransferase [Cupriavidus gilardii]